MLFKGRKGIRGTWFKKEMQTQRTDLVDTVRGEDGTNWESSAETYTLLYVKQTASGNLLYDADSSNPMLCGRWEGGSGGRGRMYIFG